MSGGSLEYVGRSMADGDVNAFLRYADELRASLASLLAEAQAGTLEGRALNPEHKHSSIAVPYPHMTEALLALPAVLAAFENLQRLGVELQAALGDLAEIATTIDRKGSGDDSGYDVVDDAVTWMRRRIGLAPHPHYTEGR